MNILIVDDEPYSADGIVNSLEWECLGISRVFKAYSMAGAQKIFEEENVDILLSDIEMPKGSGLDLVAWVREKKYPTVCMFLTCYSEFDYASKAIQLSVMDYILKPVRYEDLAEKIYQAGTKVQQNKEAEAKKIHGDYWEREKTLRIKQFIDELTDGLMKIDQNSLERSMVQHHIDDSVAKQPAYIVLVKLQPNRDYEEWDKGLIDYAFRNMVVELFTPLVVPKGELLYLLIIPSSDFADEKAFKNHFEIALPTMKSAIPAEILAYYDNPCLIMDYYKTYQTLIKDTEHNLAVSSTLFKHGNNYDLSRLPEIDVALWSNSLLSHDSDTIIDSISKILNSSKNFIVGKSTLRALHLKLIDAIYAALDTYNKPLHQPFLDDEALLFSDATNSVSDFLIWVEDITEKTIEFLEPNSGGSIIDSVLEYIDANISEDISRAAISEHVHLNPDYLSFLFREKCGVSLSTFILNERIKAAKQLLVTSNLPINEIAIRTGFQSISYFSKQFKKVVNETPVQFRKRH